MKELVENLIKKNKTISIMESCTGGGLANSITNIDGASEVFKFGAVTYSNEFKVKMGVSNDIIKTYTVYSIETAKEMSKIICDFADSDYGIGITGKLNRADKNNLHGEDNIVYYSIYDRNSNMYYSNSIIVNKDSRSKNKDLVISLIMEKIISII